MKNYNMFGFFGGFEDFFKEPEFEIVEKKVIKIETKNKEDFDRLVIMAREFISRSFWISIYENSKYNGVEIDDEPMARLLLEYLPKNTYKITFKTDRQMVKTKK